MDANSAIPPVYDPPLSDAVIACAQRIATELLDTGTYDYVRGVGYAPLYQMVRTRMNRRPIAYKDRPTLDDESISEGIIRAINRHTNSAFANAR